MKKKMILIVAIFVSALMLPVSALAENDPRDSLPGVGGVSAFVLYTRHYNGNDFYQNDNNLDDNADFDFNLTMARLIHFFDLGNDWILELDVLQPFGEIDFESVKLGIDSNSNGIGDTVFVGHINTPWLIDRETMKYGMSCGFYLTTPTGEYDNDKAVNIGANRWAYKFEATPVIWKVDRMVLEVTGEVQFYGDNDDYLTTSVDQEKDPLYATQVHLSYDITDSFWVGISHYFYSGGETEVYGKDQDDEEKTQAIRFTGALGLSSNVVLLLQYQTETERENGVKQDFLGARLAYFW